MTARLVVVRAVIRWCSACPHYGVGGLCCAEVGIDRVLPGTATRFASPRIPAWCPLPKATRLSREEKPKACPAGCTCLLHVSEEKR
jgi:hypothetical protein